jgi:hypothetical protein
MMSFTFDGTYPMNERWSAELMSDALWAVVQTPKSREVTVAVPRRRANRLHVVLLKRGQAD